LKTFVTLVRVSDYTTDALLVAARVRGLRRHRHGLLRWVRCLVVGGRCGSGWPLLGLWPLLCGRRALSLCVGTWHSLI